MSKESIPLIAHLEGFLKELYNDGWMLPDFKNATKVVCISDYVWADKKNHRFNLHAFLFFDLFQECRPNHFFVNLHALKKRENRCNTKPPFIDYKKLKGYDKSKDKQRLLPEFLDISDKIPGLLVVFCVDKNIKTIFSNNDYGEPIRNQLLNNGYGKWQPHIFRKLLEAILFQSFFTSKLLHPNQSYEWRSDRDAINGDGIDQNKQDINLEVLESFLDLFGIRPTETKYGIVKENPNILDFMSIADLAAGACAKYLNAPDNIKSYSYDIVKWLKEENNNLKKIVIQVQQENDEIQISIVKLKEKSESLL